MDVYWLEQTDIDVPFGDAWLSGGERGHLAGLRIPKRRADWRLGRWTAKCAVSGYLNLPCDVEALAATEVRPAPSGAPMIYLHGEPAPVVLSLSHSHSTGFCVVAPAGTEVGCDVERVEPRSPAFLADYFTLEEQQLVAQTPPTKRDQLLTLLWSAKESALKGLRCGLRLDTRSLNATPAQTSSEEWCPVSISHIGGKLFQGWWRASRDLIYTIVAGEIVGQPIWLQPAFSRPLPITKARSWTERAAWKGGCRQDCPPHNCPVCTGGAGAFACLARLRAPLTHPAERTTK